MHDHPDRVEKQLGGAGSGGQLRRLSLAPACDRHDDPSGQHEESGERPAQAPGHGLAEIARAAPHILRSCSLGAMSAAARIAQVRWTGARSVAGAALKRAGLEVRRHHPLGPRRARLLAEWNVELVIDVGANRGQYAQELRRYGYRDRIVSFEPLLDPYTALQGRSAADPRWQVRRLALSDGDPDLELGATDNFGSALPVAPRLATLFPEAVPPTRERVPAARLDQVDLDLPAAGRALLKLDVQGYELRVFAGSVGILDAVGIVETELSVVALYTGQALIGESLRVLDEAGFALVALEPILRDWRTGEHLQFDGLFVRRG